MTRTQKRLFVHRQQKIWENRLNITALDEKFCPLVNLIRETTNIPPIHHRVSDLFGW